MNYFIIFFIASILYGVYLLTKCYLKNVRGSIPYKYQSFSIWLLDGSFQYFTVDSALHYRLRYHDSEIYTGIVPSMYYLSCSSRIAYLAVF